MKFDKWLGKRLALFREYSKLSQRELGEKMQELGHHTWVQNIVSRKERGTSRIRVEELYDLCHILGWGLMPGWGPLCGCIRPGIGEDEILERLDKGLCKPGQLKSLG